MANLRTVDYLLNRLQAGDESFWAPRPAAPVARAVAAARAAREGSQTELPAAGLRELPTPTDAPSRRVAETRTSTLPQAAPRVDALLDRVADIRPSVVQTPSASLELSATAQWLQRSVLPEGTHAQAPSIRAAQPLLGAAPADADKLAQALRTSIAQSGLFYESHLADWVVQRYPEALLRREPQAVWHEAAPAHDEASPASVAFDSMAPVALSLAGDDASHGSTVDLMRAQLQALESRQFCWQGELWPGQGASITITDDGTSQNDESAAQNPAAWRTRVTLHLPELGRVDVDLRLAGGSLSVEIEAPSLRSVELLREAGADLVSTLEARLDGNALLGVRQAS